MQFFDGALRTKGLGCSSLFLHPTAINSRSGSSAVAGVRISSRKRRAVEVLLCGAQPTRRVKPHAHRPAAAAQGLLAAIAEPVEDRPEGVIGLAPCDLDARI